MAALDCKLIESDHMCIIGLESNSESFGLKWTECSLKLIGPACHWEYTITLKLNKIGNPLQSVILYSKTIVTDSKVKKVSSYR